MVPCSRCIEENSRRRKGRHQSLRLFASTPFLHTEFPYRPPAVPIHASSVRSADAPTLCVLSLMNGQCNQRMLSMTTTTSLHRERSRCVYNVYQTHAMFAPELQDVLSTTTTVWLVRHLLVITPALEQYPTFRRDQDAVRLIRQCLDRPIVGPNADSRRPCLHRCAKLALLVACPPVGLVYTRGALI